VGATPPAASGPRAAAEPVPVLQPTLLGQYSWAVTTASPQAQAYFDQGLRLMYAYAREEAQRSFRQARSVDPACAMCWWGEAWSLGPYLNGPMDTANVGRAYASLRHARQRAGSGTPVEAAVIQALAARYAAVQPARGRLGLDSAYATAMGEVYRQYPEHADVATLYADALMLLEPRRGVWPMSKPSIPLIHGVLERVLARDISHPGACHAYIHATETTPRVVAAQACADLLGPAIPGVSHINHMPSHTYNRVGRWGDATAANLVAVETDRRSLRGEGYAIYPGHNLHMLLYSASADGQEAVAVQAASDYAAMVTADGMGLQSLVLVRFGRFGEVLALRQAPQHPVHEGLWAFARGLAHLRQGAPDSARAWLARVDSLARHTPSTRTFRSHEPARLLGIVGNLLRGEILRSAGQTSEALAALREAETLEAGLTYDEPEPLPFTVSDYLGAALLEAGRPAEAVPVYQAALLRRPQNGWSLFGLERAQRAAGSTADAERTHAALLQAWTRSPVALAASRF
jgi:tetratricopeptide (TPR) repeat protein